MMLAPMRSVEVAVALGVTEILRAPAGFVATPEGREDRAICTVPENALFETIETVSACGTPPWTTNTVAGVTESVKSGVTVDVGGGAETGGVLATGATCVVVPPPQAETKSANETARNENGEPNLRTAVPLRWVDGSRASTIQS